MKLVAIAHFVEDTVFFFNGMHIFLALSTSERWKRWRKEAISTSACSLGTNFPRQPWGDGEKGSLDGDAWTGYGGFV